MALLQQALWINRRTIVLPSDLVQQNQSYELLYSPGEEGIPLDSQFQLPAQLDVEKIKNMLKGELALAGKDSQFRTGVQVAGVLDDLFYFDGKLGPHYPSDPHENISISVWAPTAQSVKLLLFQRQTDTTPAGIVPMIAGNGVWSAEIENSWRGQYYLFSVTVYVPQWGRVVENLVTDPYSTDLGLNGIKSRFTDLSDPAHKPHGWDQHATPEIGSVNELTLWELHVRDFSAFDETVPPEHRGTYLAFTHPDSNGMRHLRRLAEAGLKAVHLLPTFHVFTINEDKSVWKTTGDLSIYPADGTQQQAAVSAIKDEDAFNWGYDPMHYLAPEGSYAVNPDNRVREYRTMVQALHGIGLRVVQDQVFNHTHSSGQLLDSVLDRIVPGYYHRLDADGNVMNATCCSDTASEHRMMEKLMLDAVVQNADQYRIDGFRFDLMGFHYVSNMRKILAALDPKVYLYGEGWGTQATDHLPGMPNATQHNLFGCGIGTFNDRMRDAIRGGSPFSDRPIQGFATGNAADLNASDLIRASLAGNMRDFSFTNCQGQPTTAGALPYNGQAAGYTASPAECINFCSVHDNQTLFDVIQLKAPAHENTATRARRQVLALSLIALGQGIPFFHAGDELLRSKNMDNNSYNSGDWFNKLDFTYQSNNWGTGLPLGSENENSWPVMQPLLANPALRPATADILYTRNAFEALLRVRYSSGLFQMQTLAEVQSNLHFLGCEPGVISMLLTANFGSYPGYQKLLVVFNANDKVVCVKSAELMPHPALPNCGSYDAAGGCLQVAGLTTAVFVER